MARISPFTNVGLQRPPVPMGPQRDDPPPPGIDPEEWAGIPAALRAEIRAQSILERTKRGVRTPQQQEADDIDLQVKREQLRRMLNPTPPQGRDPGLAQGTALDNLLRQLQIDAFPEDRQMQRDIGYGGLDIQRGRLALDEELGRGRLALEQLIAQEGTWAQKEQAALARGQLAEAIEARREANKIARDRMALEQSMGEAQSRRADLGVNLERNEQFGYVVDAEGTGVAKGTQTARGAQQQFSNLLALRDRSTAMQQADSDRQERQGDRVISLRERLQQRQDAMGQQAIDNNRAQLALQLQYMNQTAARPQSPGMLMQRPGVRVA